jgi:putative flippase GtrA
MTGTLARLQGHRLWQPFTYLAVGGWNTVFGLGLFWIAYRYLGSSVNYLVLLACCNLLAITNAFVCYKFLVFRTRGNWLREYVRFWAVYGVATLVGIGIVALLVQAIGMSPVTANFLATAVVIAGGFIGHKRVSFAAR